MSKNIESIMGILNETNNSESVRQYASDLLKADVITDEGMRVIAIGLIEGFMGNGYDMTVLAIKPKSKRCPYVLGHYLTQLKPSEDDPTHYLLQWSGGSYDWEASEAIARFIERTHKKIIWTDLEWRTH